jgi:hypothetical protein
MLNSLGKRRSRSPAHAPFGFWRYDFFTLKIQRCVGVMLNGVMDSAACVRAPPSFGGARHKRVHTRL